MINYKRKHEHSNNIWLSNLEYSYLVHMYSVSLDKVLHHISCTSLCTDGSLAAPTNVARKVLNFNKYALQSCKVPCGVLQKLTSIFLLICTEIDQAIVRWLILDILTSTIKHFASLAIYSSKESSISSN